MPVVRAEHNYFLSEGKKAMSPKEYHNMIHAMHHREQNHTDRNHIEQLVEIFHKLFRIIHKQLEFIPIGIHGLFLDP
jgi:hypothetical protein